MISFVKSEDKTNHLHSCSSRTYQDPGDFFQKYTASIEMPFQLLKIHSLLNLTLLQKIGRETVNGIATTKPTETLAITAFMNGIWIVKTKRKLTRLS